MLISFGLGADKNLAEKLFYVFDEDSSGTVDYKELIVGLEVLKDDTIDEKLKSNLFIQSIHLSLFWFMRWGWIRQS